MAQDDLFLWYPIVVRVILLIEQRWKCRVMDQAESRITLHSHENCSRGVEDKNEGACVRRTCSAQLLHQRTDFELCARRVA